MQDVVFESTDLGESEEFLSATYARMRIGSDSEQSRTRVSRRWLGTENFDDLEFDYELDYRAAPLNRICLVRVHQGYIEENFIGAPSDVFLPGDVTFLSPPELPYSGRTCAKYDVAMFDPGLLDSVATPMPSRRRPTVEITGHRPVSEAAARHLFDLIDYLRVHVLANPSARSSPLVVSTASSHLAAAVLATFPSNAAMVPTAADRNSDTSTLVPRAVAFIEENIDTDITLADIAAALRVTPRAVQYMFRQHLDCTPMTYVRRVRLHHAHCDLAAADPDNATVASVAHRWGFVHGGRFAAYYRQAYGRDPSKTLRE